MIFDYFARRRRERLRAQPFPSEWRAVLARNVPYLRTLDDAQREELEGWVFVFLEDRPMEGCGGLVLTDEIRVTIAAQACLLLLGREREPYPNLDVILVYPAAFRAKTQALREGVVLEGAQTRLGEASTRGVLVLSWDDVVKGARDPRDGHNVVLHEFAHALDQEDGEGDGAPILSQRARYRPWAEVLGRAYQALVEDEARHRKTIIDTYGATNPAEFFAVVTETFFERPVALRRQHPELYEQLALYYKQDPAARLRG